LTIITKYASDKRTQDLNDFCTGVNMATSRPENQHVTHSNRQCRRKILRMLNFDQPSHYV